MRKVGLAGLLLVVIAASIGVFYLDIFNLKTGKDDAIASIIEYEDIRRPAERLINYLGDPDPEVRARAALALGRIGDTKSAEHLFAVLEDTSGYVSRTAAFAIGLTGHKKFAPRLLELCNTFETELLAACLQSVGRLTDSSMVDDVDEIAGYLDNPDHRVREQACYALWRSAGKVWWSRLADVARNDPVRAVKIAALYSLVRLGIKEPVDIYAEWLPDSDPFVRGTAYRGLGIAKDDSKTSLAAVGLNDRDNNVVSQAITALTAIGSARASGFLTARYENETDERLKVQLLESFSQLKSEVPAERVNSDLDTCKSDNIKAAGIVYLAKIRGGEAIPLIDSLESKKNRRLNVGIAAALKEIGGEYVKPRLSTLFKDSIPEVRAAAFEALCVIDAVNIDYYLKTALDDTDFVVRSMAVDQIGKLKAKEYLGRLMSIFRNAEREPTDLKRSVVAAAGEFLTEEPADSLAEEILFHGLEDKDYLVSRDAALIYRDRLDTDKTVYINKPSGLLSKRAIKAFITGYSKYPRALISTTRGDIEIELYTDVAPLTVYNFIKLAKDRFYDNLTFHRVVPAFVVQGGDPRGDGWGGPGYYIRDEYSNLPFERGSLGIATSGKDSGGSQFFIMLSDAPHLDARYTLFGRVVAGMNAVDQITRGDRIKNIRVIEEKRK